MSSSPIALSVAAILLMCSGCSGVQLGPTVATVTRLGTASRVPVPPESLVVYMNEKDVPGPFERLALIHTSGDWKLVGPSDLVAKAKKEAAKLGANALLLGTLEEPTSKARAVDVLIPAVSLPHGLKRRQEIVALYVSALDANSKSSNNESGSKP